MPSADFTINGSATPPAIAVSASSTVTLALTDTSFRTVTWSIVGNHHPDAVNPTITPGGSPLGATATFPMPSGAGQAYLIECVVNNGRDDEGQVQASLTKRALVGVNATSSSKIPFANGEKLERDAVYGWTVVMNELLHA
jgi:hypothetical protein